MIDHQCWTILCREQICWFQDTFTLFKLNYCSKLAQKCSCYVSLLNTQPSLEDFSLATCKLEKRVLQERDIWKTGGQLYCGLFLLLLLLPAMNALTFTWPSLAIVRALYSGSWHHPLLWPFTPPKSRISNTTVVLPETGVAIVRVSSSGFSGGHCEKCSCTTRHCPTSPISPTFGEI